MRAIWTTDTLSAPNEIILFGCNRILAN